MASENNKDQKSIWQLGRSAFLAHFGSAVFCLVVALMLLQIMEHIALQIIIGVVVLLLYYSFLSGNAWQIGNRDLNKVHFGRMEKDLSRGFKIGLIASIPMFLLDIALIVLKIWDFGSVTEWALVVYRVLNPHVLVFINLVTGTGTLYDISILQVISICLFTFVTPICMEIGYLLGYRDIVMMDKLLYKRNKKKEK